MAFHLYCVEEHHDLSTIGRKRTMATTVVERILSLQTHLHTHTHSHTHPHFERTPDLAGRDRILSS